MRFLYTLITILLLGFAGAQLAVGSDPAQVADEAVGAWLEQDRPDLMELPSLSPEQACEMLPGLIQSPPAPAGTTVNLAERRELPSDDPALKRYSYPASLPGGGTEIVEVSLEEREGSWEATRVGARLETGGGLRDWLQTPPASWLFVLFSLGVLYLLVRPSFLRRWLAEGAAVIREHRRLVITTQVVFYALFGLGALTGSLLPEACETAVLEVLTAAITSVGATDAYGSLNIPRAATVTFYQNFGVVTLSLLFSLGFLFGVPAYLVGILSFYTQGIPFGLLGGANILQLIPVLVLLVLELTSYFLVIAGGGILLATLIRGGFSAYGKGVRRLALMLPFALVLLLIGAWYESALIILPQLLGAPTP